MTTTTAARGSVNVPGNRDLDRGGGVALSACWLAAATVPLFFVSSADRQTDVRLAAVSLTLVGLGCLCATSGSRGVATALREFDIGPWFVVFYTFGFGVLSMSWRPPADLRVQLDPHAVTAAIGVLALGLMAWTASYCASGRRIAHGAESEAVSPAPTVLLVLFTAGLLGRLLEFLSGNFGYVGDAAARISAPAGTGQLIAVLTSCSRFALVLLAVRYVVDQTARNRMLFGAALALEICIGLLTGMKSEFLLTLFVILPVLAIGTGRFPRRILAGSAVLLVLVVVPFVTAYRADVRPTSAGVGPGNAFRAAPDVLGSVYAGTSVSTVADESREVLASRLGQINSVGIIVQKTPTQVAEKPISTMLLAPLLGFVPRAIWHDKPVLDSGYRFSQEY
ncbi:MAG: hypothetical protein LC789_06245, partial [Actinobacteria bacterium]|nr:hypothetical protein [Actinomycetota bacterium]